MSLAANTVMYVVSADDLRQIALDAARAALAEVRPAHEAILPDRPLNQTELARLLRCSTEHIRQLEKRGELVSTFDGSQKQFESATVAAFLRRRLDGTR